MTKEEVIKEAWGEYYNKYKDRISLENGLMFYKSEKIRKEIKNALGELECPYMYSEFRPKSLQGIEDNNDWIKIKSEADLPKEGHYWVIYKNGELSDCPKSSELFEDNEYWMQKVTHYQPIQKPKPPIY